MPVWLEVITALMPLTPLSPQSKVADSSLVWCLMWCLSTMRDGVLHLGANILFYLVFVNLVLAGTYRAASNPTNPFPLTVWQGFAYMCTIMSIGKFLHYLARSSRR